MVDKIEAKGPHGTDEIWISGRNHKLEIDVTMQGEKRRTSARISIQTDEQYAELIKMLNEAWARPRHPGDT